MINSKINHFCGIVTNWDPAYIACTHVYMCMHVCTYTYKVKKRDIHSSVGNVNKSKINAHISLTQTKIHY